MLSCPCHALPCLALSFVIASCIITHYTLHIEALAAATFPLGVGIDEDELGREGRLFEVHHRPSDEEDRARVYQYCHAMPSSYIILTTTLLC